MQITSAGDESMFVRRRDAIEWEFRWGCGCPTRSEFIMTYEPVSPLELRLCHDDMADSCKANCTATLSFDLGQALEAAGTNNFIFVD